jgi:hypothetical protein
MSRQEVTFFFKDYTIESNLNVSFPLSLIASNLILEDTVNFNLSNQVNDQSINNGELVIFANNGYPFDAKIQLTLYDELGNFLENLTVNNIIQSANVNSVLRATDKKESVLTVPLSSASISNLYATKKMVFQIAFTTTEQPQFLKIYEDYEMDIKIVGDFSYNINAN